MKDAFLFVFGMAIFVLFTYAIVYSVMFDPNLLMFIGVGILGSAAFMIVFSKFQSPEMENDPDGNEFV